MSYEDSLEKSNNSEKDKTLEELKIVNSETVSNESKIKHWSMTSFVNCIVSLTFIMFLMALAV